MSEKLEPSEAIAEIKLAADTEAVDKNAPTDADSAESENNGAETELTQEAGPQATEEEPSDEIQRSILEMKHLVSEVSADAGSTISKLDEVQDRLLNNLDSLNKRIENYIELLAEQRKSA